ncbi:MAG: Vgb family protein [Armatimonadota bacterium]
MTRLQKMMMALVAVVLIAMPVCATASYMYVSDSSYDWYHTRGIYRWDCAPTQGIPAPGDGFTGSVFANSWPVVVFSGMDIGPNGDLYAAGWYTNNVVRIDPVTGEDKGVFIADYRGLVNPDGMTWGPDGNLYISDGGSNTVARFDAVGNPLPGLGKAGFEFASGGGLSGVAGMTFGQDGNLYVASSSTDQILRYNGVTGAFMDVFASGCPVPVDVKFGPDGGLYVACMAGPGWGADNGYVNRYDGTTGAFDRLFADAKGAYGMDFGPDGNLYVSGFWDKKVKQYDGTTGAYLSDYAPGIIEGSAPHYIVFSEDVVPEPSALLALACGGVAMLGRLHWGRKK